MSAMNTRATLDGLFKEVYADKMKVAVPVHRAIQLEIPFSSKDKELGNEYHMPVVLQSEHGITHASPHEDDYTLLVPISGQIKDARVDGYPIVLRSRLGSNAASRAVQSRNAFEDATRYLVGNMLDSISKRLEIELLYGQAGLGVIESVSGSFPNLSIQITAPEWAPGIWVGSVKMHIDVYNGSTYVRTVEIKSVDVNTRTLVVDSVTGTGTIAANDVLYFRGAYGKEMAGIHRVLTQTTGNLFNIPVSSYELWKGTQYQASSSPVLLSHAVLQNAIAAAMPFGLEGDVIALIAPQHWDDLMIEQAALRRYDSSYSNSKLNQGSQKLEFFSQNGKITIMVSPYVKGGYAYVLNKRDWLRIGSTDITFKRPLPGDERFFLELNDQLGFELRCYTIQAIFCSAPARNVVITNLKVN